MNISPLREQEPGAGYIEGVSPEESPEEPVVGEHPEIVLPVEDVDLHQDSPEVEIKQEEANAEVPQEEQQQEVQPEQEHEEQPVAAAQPEEPPAEGEEHEENVQPPEKQAEIEPYMPEEPDQEHDVEPQLEGQLEGAHLEEEHQPEEEEEHKEVENPAENVGESQPAENEAVNQEEQAEIQQEQEEPVQKEEENAPEMHEAEAKDDSIAQLESLGHDLEALDADLSKITAYLNAKKNPVVQAEVERLTSYTITATRYYESPKRRAIEETQQAKEAGEELLRRSHESPPKLHPEFKPLPETKKYEPSYALGTYQRKYEPKAVDEHPKMHEQSMDKFLRSTPTATVPIARKAEEPGSLASRYGVIKAARVPENYTYKPSLRANAGPDPFAKPYYYSGSHNY